MLLWLVVLWPLAWHGSCVCVAVVVGNGVVVSVAVVVCGGGATSGWCCLG